MNISKEYNFSVVKTQWYKRRRPDASETQITDIKVFDFKLSQEHSCKVQACIDGEITILQGRVYANEVYQTGKNGRAECVITHWGVQAINSNGVSIVLRVNK